MSLHLIFYSLAGLTGFFVIMVMIMCPSTKKPSPLSVLANNWDDDVSDDILDAYRLRLLNMLDKKATLRNDLRTEFTKRLDLALQTEKYEEASIIRDAIEKLNKQHEQEN